MVLRASWFNFVFLSFDLAQDGELTEPFVIWVLEFVIYELLSLILGTLGNSAQFKHFVFLLTPDFFILTSVCMLALVFQSEICYFPYEIEQLNNHFFGGMP